jgi:hypothetical protein
MRVMFNDAVTIFLLPPIVERIHLSTDYVLQYWPSESDPLILIEALTFSVGRFKSIMRLHCMWLNLGHGTSHMRPFSNFFYHRVLQSIRGYPAALVPISMGCYGFRLGTVDQSGGCSSTLFSLGNRKTFNSIPFLFNNSKIPHASCIPIFNGDCFVPVGRLLFW